MSHYHLPYRGLPQEILEEIFKYSLSDGITIVPKSEEHSDPIPAQLDHVRQYSEVNDGTIDNGKSFTFNVNRTNAYGLLLLNRDQYKVARRILRDAVVHVPLVLPWAWTGEVLRGLPRLKHVSFMDMFPETSGYYLFTDTQIWEHKKLESVTFKNLTLGNGEVEDLIDVAMEKLHHGTLTKLRIELCDQLPEGLTVGEFFDYYMYLKKFLPADQRPRCRKFLKGHVGFDTFTKADCRRAKAFNDFCDRHEKELYQLFQQAGWNVYMDGRYPGEDNAVVAIQRENEKTKGRRPITIRRQRVGERVFHRAASEYESDF